MHEREFYAKINENFVVVEETVRKNFVLGPTLCLLEHA